MFKKIIFLLICIPSLSWSDHKTSDDLTGKGIICGEHKLFYFTKYTKKLLEDSLSPSYWKKTFEKYEVKKNKNIVIYYNTSENSEKLIRYQTDLTSILFLGVSYYTGIFRHLNSDLKTIKPFSYYGYIDRQNLTFSEPHTLYMEDCKLIDNAYEIINDDRNKYLEDKKKEKELKIIEEKELKKNQKI